MDRGKVDPFLTGVRLIGLVCGWRGIFDVEGEVVPVLAEGEKGGFHKVVEDVEKEKRFLGVSVSNDSGKGNVEWRAYGDALGPPFLLKVPNLGHFLCS